MSEQDTRERLEADICDWLTHDLQGNPLYEVFADSVEPDSMPEIRRWLDRQAAITEREVKLRELYRFEENHRASIDKTEEVNRKLNARIAELTAERDKLKERIARFDSISSFDGIANLLVQLEDLTAERDELQKRNEQLEYANKLASKSEARKVEYIDQLVEYIDKLEAECDELETKRQNDYDAWQLQMDKLTAERDELQAAIDAMGNGQFFAMYREACQERDALKHDREKVWCDCNCCGWQEEREQMQRVIHTQAESFRKLEVELAMRDD